MPEQVESLASDVVLKDGSTLQFRPQRPDDTHLIEELLRKLSPRSRSLRFMSDGSDPQRSAALLGTVKQQGGRGILAVSGQLPVVVAHGLFLPTRARWAEVALEVADEFQGKGVGSLLVGQLAQLASRLGIEMFEAVVEPDNWAMLEVFSQTGFAVRTKSGPGEVMVEFPTALTEDALDAYDRREEQSGAAAVETVLRPRSVALVGAGRRLGTIAGEVFHNLLMGGFQGPVFAVNSVAPVVQSIPAFATVADLPGPVDLAVITVPAAAVVPVARECAAKGVRALVVISAGFAEDGEEGRQRQAELLEICTAAGMRLVGPNCMGVINTDAEVGLNATFAPDPPTPGKIGFLSQSGALGLAVIGAARNRGLGLSSFVSAGNKADISGNDLLNFWHRDPHTEVIALYLESFGNPRKFARIAARVSRDKPIVAVKSGVSSAGRRAAASHTASLVSGTDTTVEALFEKAGVVRAHSLAEMFDLASLLSSQPLPDGDGVAIITNGGGPGVLCADACEGNSLRVPELSAATRDRLAATLPQAASLGNPVDLLASASADDYRAALGIVADDPQVNAVIVLFIPPLVTRADAVGTAILEAAEQLSRPLPMLGVFMANSGISGELRSATATIPCYTFPENAALALAGAWRLARWRQLPVAAVASPQGVDPIAVATTLATQVGDQPEWLDPTSVGSILSPYGIPVVTGLEVATPEEAGVQSRHLGAPLVVKALGPAIVHKTELGAVRMGLAPGEAVEVAAREMAKRLTSSGTPATGFLLQPQLGPGVELLVGATNDPAFGTLVAVAAGGTAVELVRDLAVGLAPLNHQDAERMLRSLATFPLLDGYRGAPRCDLDALCDTVVRIACLAESHASIWELEANPVLATAEGVWVLDARIRVGPEPPALPLGARRVHGGSPRAHPSPA